MANYFGSKINPARFHRSQIKFFIVLILMAAFMLLPIVFIVFNAFKPMDELFAFPPRFIVKRPVMDNFRMLFAAMSISGISIDRYIANSLVSTGFTVVLTLLINITAGYALSKKKFRLKKLFFNVNTYALMFVPIAVTIPRYLIIVRLGLINSFLAHIIPMLAMPVGLFLVKQFIDQIPDSLIEAAKIDGANDWFVIWNIINPMTRPALATVIVLSFQASWNSIEPSTLYLDNESLKNFAYFMGTLTAANSGAAGMGMSAASALIMFIPNLIVFIFMQSKVMNTMAYSGLK